MPFEYVQSINRYRDTDTGRFVSQLIVHSLIRRSIEHSQNGSITLSQMTADGDISASTFNGEARNLVKREYIRQYVLGRGGRDSMTQRDWGIVGRQLRDQYAYLNNFTQQISNGAYEGFPDALNNRLGLYFDSARQAFNRAELEVRGLPAMPQVPGDGQTACMTRCKCNLEFVRTATSWLIYWRLNASAKHCPDCLGLSSAWSPLIFEGGSFTNLQLDTLPISKAVWRTMEARIREWLILAEQNGDYEFTKDYIASGISIKISI